MSGLDGPRDFQAFIYREDGLRALFRESNVSGAALQLRPQGTVVPQHAFGEQDRIVKWPQWCTDSIEKELTVEDLISRTKEELCLNRSLDLVADDFIETIRPGMTQRLSVGNIIRTTLYITAALRQLEKGQLTLCLEYEVSGTDAQGSLDHVLMIKGLEGSVIFKDAEVGQALTPEYQAQLLAQMSVMRDMQEAQATDPANTKDIYGVLTDSKEWYIYRYKPGSRMVEYERYSLSASPGQEPEMFEAEIETLLSALVGVMLHQLGAGD